MTSNAYRLPLLLLLVACSAAPRAASAAWPHDPNAGNVPVCTAARYQLLRAIVPDGAGGAILAWEDDRTGAGLYDIYAQRLAADGTPRWTPDGAALCTATGSQSYPALTPDGAGGAIVAWQDYRSGTSNDIYVQRVNANGVPQWTTDGVALCTSPNDQLYPTIASDGAGGAIVTWTDFRSGSNYDVYAQRVSASGLPQWPANGVVLCSAANNQDYPVIVSDGVGGAIVVWDDYRSGTNYDVYAQRVNTSGVALWAPNGAPLCTATGTQASPKIIADGAGGAIATWYDYRVSNAHIYAQRVSPAGAQQWATDGVAVCTASGDQTNPVPASDGAGGAIIAWNDGRTIQNWDIYAQRVSAGGVPQWTANGVALSTASADQLNPVIVADGNGGAIAIWNDSRNGPGDIFGQRVSAGGGTQWAANGVAICTAASSQASPVVASDGAGGAITAWWDQRNGTFYDVYAQKVERFGYLGDPAPAIASVHDVPNDQGGQVKLSWYASWLDAASDPNLSSYDVYRSVPGSVATDALRRGARASTTFAEPPQPGGPSFVIDPARAQLYAWQYVGSVAPAHFLSAYGYLAATTGDSIADSNPPTVFMVVARNASSSMYWLSAPDSGYSVDNLAPATPAPFTGMWSSGTVALHWDPSAEPDFSTYRLYRGNSADFVPGPTNEIATLPDTGYVDVAGAPYYYKLSAVDAHGNESGFALYTPIGSADAPGIGAPAALRLGPAQPNPAERATRFAFELPRATAIELVVHDLTGRAVRVLSRGAHAAGRFTVDWDLRDDTGHAVPAGIYFVRLVAHGRSLVRSVAVTP